IRWLTSNGDNCALRGTFGLICGQRAMCPMPDATGNYRRAVDEFVHQIGSVQHGPGGESRGGGWRDPGAFLSDTLPGGSACLGARVEGACLAAVPLLLRAARRGRANSVLAAFRLLQ